MRGKMASQPQAKGIFTEPSFAEKRHQAQDATSNMGLNDTSETHPTLLKNQRNEPRSHFDQRKPKSVSGASRPKTMNKNLVRNVLERNKNSVP